MPDVLVYVAKNHIEVINLKDGSSAAGVAPFTTHRLLVGELAAAEELLKRLLREIGLGGMFSKLGAIVIQPLSMIEGGLSSVEEQVLRELGASVRAREVRIVTGSGKLSREDANAELEQRSGKRFSAVRSNLG